MNPRTGGLEEDGDDASGGGPSRRAEVVVEAARLGPAQLVVLRGDINFTSAEATEERLAALVAGAPAVVVDLTGVRYLDSSGLSMLLRQARAAAGRDAAFLVVRGSGAQPLFRLCTVGRAMRVLDSREAALAALADG